MNTSLLQVRRSVQETNIDDDELELNHEEELTAPADEESLELPGSEKPTVEDGEDSDAMDQHLGGSQPGRGLLSIMCTYSGSYSVIYVTAKNVERAWCASGKKNKNA